LSEGPNGKGNIVKITNGINPVGTGPDAARTKSSAQPPRGTAATAGDQVELSSLAAQLQQAGAASAEPIDLARIAEIKQAIVEGRFEVNPERIANGLIESAREMLAGKG
jgi:negative regulator of flagellin synthesis FlgM